MSVFDGNTPRRKVELWPEDREPTNNLERLIASANPYLQKERDEAERVRAEAASRCRAQGGGDKDSSDNLAAQAAHAGADTERDAARYRWLRSQETSLETRQYDKGIVNGPSCYHEVEGIRELKWGEELDNAIDAAIAANTSPEKKA